MKPTPADPAHPASLSRRAFLKGLGAAAATAATAGAESVAAELEKANAEKVVGPGAAAVSFVLNGQPVKLSVEPRVTLLDVLRLQLGRTGAKEGCDRGACGACTVLVNGKPVYSCMRLALEVEGAKVETVEGLAPEGQLTPVQQAFVKCDGLQCGFCTPGFVMTTTALLREKPQPTAEEVKHACSGNICRCGSHPRIVEAALTAAGVKTVSKTEIISRHA